MNAQRSAEIQVLLEGIPLPATRDDLIRYAESQDGDVAVLLRERLPRGEYSRLDDVGEALVRRPERPQAPPRPPQPESGKPPGGDDYLTPHPESGAVRLTAPRTNPPEQAIEQQTQTQQKQKARQEG